MPDSTKRKRHFQFFASTAFLAMIAGAASAAQSADISIPEQPLSDSLKVIARQTGENILFTPDSVAGMRAHALRGYMTAREAVDSLLENTELQAIPDGTNGLIIKRADEKSPAPSQPAEAAPTQLGDNFIEEVIVTGSRIVENGYQSPTPVTGATTDDLSLGTPTDLNAGLSKLPQFIGSNSPNATNNLRPGATGDVLNLRGLGPNRTLVLMDGLRVPPTSFTNTVNVDILPQLLVQRVDVVTGGASASYGSDAVAGVVNYILDTKFTGVKGVTQGGISTFGDAANVRLGLAAGIDVGDRGHLLVSGEFYNNDGYDQTARPKLNDYGLEVGSVIGSAAAPGSAANPFIAQTNLVSQFLSAGGLVLAGPLAGTQFVSSGAYRPIIKGAPTGTSNVCHFPCDGYRVSSFSAAAATRNINLFGRFSYDLDDDTTAYVQLLGSQSDSFANSLASTDAFPPDTVFSGNAFLPAPLQTILTNTNTLSFNLYTWHPEYGPIRAYERLDNYDEALGAKGKLGRFSWTLDASHGASIDNVSNPNQLNLPNYYAALDAVVSPSSGQIVCNASLNANPVVAARYAACEPFNEFGVGSASGAAVSYVMGTSRYNVSNTTNDISGSIAGDIFSLPAGPLSAVVGGDYRTAILRIKSNANPGTPPDFTGVRGVGLPNQYFLTNQTTASASEEVEEGYFEFNAPLLKNRPFVQSLALNGAGRVTSYSTTGEATTWKIGATWKVDDELLLRTTRSRDIRAPTLYDLFAGAQTTSSAVVDPHTGINAGFFQVSSGNPMLKPEVGNTLTAGFSYQPSWLDGLSMSMDYYNIEVTGAISALTALALVQNCEASDGMAPSCALISRPLPFSDHSSANTPTKVTLGGINVALIQTEGVDMDATFKTSLWSGDFSARAYASYVADFTTQLSAQQPLINYAGYNAAGSGGVAGGVPQFKGTLSANYNIDRYGIFVQENIIGSLKYGPPSVSLYIDPHIRAFITTDLTLTYRAPAVWGVDDQFFLTINNLFNATPPLVYGTSVPGLPGLSTLVGLYDTTGRAFVGGIRFHL